MCVEWSMEIGPHVTQGQEMLGDKGTEIVHAGESPATRGACSSQMRGRLGQAWLHDAGLVFELGPSASCQLTYDYPHRGIRVEGALCSPASC